MAHTRFSVIGQFLPILDGHMSIMRVIVVSMVHGYLLEIRLAPANVHKYR